MLIASALLALAGGGCGGGSADGGSPESSQDRIREVIQESFADYRDADASDVSDWCDTRLVFRPPAVGREVIDRMRAGSDSASVRGELRRAGSAEQCETWAAQFAAQISPADPSAAYADLEISKVTLDGQVATARVYYGEGENRGTGLLYLIELPGADWRLVEFDQFRSG